MRPSSRVLPLASGASLGSQTTQTSERPLETAERSTQDLASVITENFMLKCIYIRRIMTVIITRVIAILSITTTTRISRIIGVG